MDKFVGFAKSLGIGLLKALTVIVLLMLIDFGMYKFIGVSLVNLLQDIIYAINIFLDKIQSWYIR